MHTSAGVRAQIRVGIAAFVGALTATILLIWPNIPEHVIALWMTVLWSGFGVAEAVWDHRQASRVGPPVVVD